MICGQKAVCFFIRNSEIISNGREEATSIRLVDAFFLPFLSPSGHSPHSTVVRQYDMYCILLFVTDELHLLYISTSINLTVLHYYIFGSSFSSVGLSSRYCNCVASCPRLHSCHSLNIHNTFTTASISFLY